MSEQPPNQESVSPLDLVSGERTVSERLFLLWDLAIILLVSLNLALIIFDALFAIGPLAGLFESAWPAAHGWYEGSIHENFVTIDLFFVAIFVADVLAGWALAIAQKRYYRWYFYPFVRWYDVLGCIPVAGFRFLRVLRVLTIIMRLQRLGVIDIRNWAVYKTAMVYYDIVVEEISDRVVIKVLTGAQDELRSGGQELSHRVVREVIQPRQQRLVNASATHIENAIISAYQANREELQAYVANVVNRGVDNNAALKNLERVPMLGSFVSRALDDAITDTVNNVLDEAVGGLSSADFDALVQNITDSVISRLLADDIGQNSELRDAVVEILDLVKEQVAVQRWRDHFE
jgi:hypothetical protein